jgi:hypothetical protein
MQMNSTLKTFKILQNFDMQANYFGSNENYCNLDNRQTEAPIDLNIESKGDNVIQILHLIIQNKWEVGLSIISLYY